MLAEKVDDIDLLAEAMLDVTYKPLEHAQIAYPWGEVGGPLEKHQGPRKWQAEVLSEIGDHLSNPETRHTPLRLAVASGHGIGKSALIGMIINWGLDTCDDTRIVVTANTDGQLKNKTAPEVLKWSRMNMTHEKGLFNVTATSIYSTIPKREKSWRCDFMPWSKENTEAFAGLHNEGKRIIVIYDEASAIDDKIFEVTEGALTDDDTEIIWIAFGNPTRSTGRFRECWRKFSKMWSSRNIDSRDVEGTNKKLFDDWAGAYGEESDFFKVRVRGMFPSASPNQFISDELVDAAYGKHLREDQYNFAPVILSCDPAWTGDDDLVIAKRQGLFFEILDTMPKNDNDILVANKLKRYANEHNAAVIFIDQGWGTGIYSGLRTMGVTNAILVSFGEKSGRQDCFNKRAEMLVQTKEWFKMGGAIPKDDELREEAIALDSLPVLDGKYKFPPKDAMKEVIGRSPNKLDALALTFAHPVHMPEQNPLSRPDPTQVAHNDYNPYE